MGPDTAAVRARQYPSPHRRLNRHHAEGARPDNRCDQRRWDLGRRGLRTGIEWSTTGAARARAAQLVAEHRARSQEIVRNPHLAADWARAAVRAPHLLAAVQDAIGPDVAVENTFLVVKWPNRAFEIPWHQDGIDARVELDPDRSVSAWLALSDATLD
ncbi:phytanoyl-CoA dioxygenase family protein [Kitasatospora sp. NPDC001603]|uniref:phytanoyl-CoA dioxygenase family protein n=1 Tax=Kitasatospora sp. NPDC001603 TaxID=3154388 RepID=UPI0033184172